jgi:hypothetical protein
MLVVRGSPVAVVCTPGNKLSALMAVYTATNNGCVLKIILK